MLTVATRLVTLAMMMISTTKDGNGSMDMGPLYSNISLVHLCVGCEQPVSGTDSIHTLCRSRYWAGSW